MLITAVLIGIITISSGKLTSDKKTEQVFSSTADTATSDSAQNDSEMRGVWVSYMELSMENESDKSEKAFTDKFNSIAQCCKLSGFNTLIVQVRPFCDALYKSEYFPWSHILTGTQGKNPGYDPLTIMCDICRKNGLKIHAWINPYRISTSSTPSTLSGDNPYINDKSLAIETDSGIYLDPTNEAARELIISGIEEIVNNYDIDAIQFDDYFYPTDIGSEDAEQYAAYKSYAGSNCMSLEDWRKANVNMLISAVYQKIHSLSDSVEFGISPQGNIDNNGEIYADVKSWCTCKGYIDYICPQIYFSLENPALSFESSLNSWCSLDFADSVKLYVGLAGYKAGTDSDESTWLGSDEILSTEYEIVKANSKASGFILYSYNSLTAETSSSEIANLTEKLE